MAKIEKSERPSLSKNIARLRKALGLNQNELADRIGVHVNTIKEIERGTSEGRPDTRQAIASVLGCSVGELYSEGATADPAITAAAQMIERVIVERSASRVAAPTAAYSSIPQDILEALERSPERHDFVRAALGIPAPVKTPQALSPPKRGLK